MKVNIYRLLEEKLDEAIDIALKKAEAEGLYMLPPEYKVHFANLIFNEVRNHLFDYLIYET